MQALPVDLFLSKNFYKDQKLWMDQRYFRCNTPRQIADIWTSLRIGNNPPMSAAWSDCTADYPREKIVSPYPYKTAKEHYQALLAAAKAKGGPTVYTKANVPDWDGYYTRDMQADRGAQWIWGTVNQVPTILSLLTPEYQKRFVQQNYHEGVDNAPQWQASFCQPEGFMRWWAEASNAGNFQLTMSPWNIQFLSGIAANFLRQVLIGKQHVQKVPQWYGETVGFWDGTTLITWTANVQGWTLSHSMFEFSDKMETVETYKPALDANGKFIGLDHEAVFYDPDTLRATGARDVSFCPAGHAGRSGPPLHLHRVFGQSAKHQRQADAAHQGRPPIYRLLRPPLGAELGKIFRSRLGPAAEYVAAGRTRYF